MAEFELGMSTESSGDNSRVSVWELASGMQLKSYKGSCCTRRGVAMLGRQCFVAAQSGKPVLHVFNMAKEQVHMKLICPGIVSAVTCSPDGKYCVAACTEKIYVWQVASGALLTSVSRHFQSVSVLKFCDDGSCFLSGGQDNLVMVWKMSRVLSQSTDASGVNLSCSPRYTWTDHALPVTDIYCGYGGMQAHVATSSLDQTCKLYDLSSGELLCSFIFGNGITSVTLDPAELNLYAGAVDGSIYQVQLSKPGLQESNYHESNDKQLVFHGHRKQVNSLSASMDGSQLLSGSQDGTARVWDVTSRQCLKVVTHKGPVSNVLVVPRPPYLDDAPPKNVLPPIQPFKKHVTSQAAPSDQDLTLGVVTVLRGCLSERDDPLQKEKYLSEMAERVIKEGGCDQLSADGEPRKLSRKELLQRVETLQNANQGLYRFAVDELLKGVGDANAGTQM